MVKNKNLRSKGKKSQNPDDKLEKFTHSSTRYGYS